MSSLICKVFKTPVLFFEYALQELGLKEWKKGIPCTCQIPSSSSSSSSSFANIESKTSHRVIPLLCYYDQNKSLQYLFDNHWEEGEIVLRIPFFIPSTSFATDYIVCIY